jgi:thymidylate synthase
MVNKFETEYLTKARSILWTGNQREGRNGVTASLPFQTLTFDLRDGLPLMTTRKSYYKGVFGEYAALIRGPQHIDDFTKWGCNFWKKWAQPDGTINLDYGNAWVDFHGENQMETVLNLLKNDYTDRRMLITGWDPSNLKNVDLPCCHYSYQFWSDGKHLDLLWTQRSGDWMIGVPADALLASAMVNQFASLANMIPRNVTMMIGDAHIYEDHWEATREQTRRKPFDMPLYAYKTQQDLYSFEPDDFVVKHYEHHPAIDYLLKA